MAGFFRKGVGWKLRKNFYAVMRGYLNRRALRRVRTARSRPSSDGVLQQQLKASLVRSRSSIQTDQMAEVRAGALAILGVFDILAERVGFSYQLAYGTLLGAIRHGGFIPWDDDIDVSMTTSDLERFIAAAHHLPEELVLLRMNKNFWKLMDRYSIISKDGKRGIALDIFLLEEEGQRLEFINVHRYAYQSLERADVFPVQRVPFAQADCTLPVPARPERVLETIYRNWRQLPPEDQRVSPHLGREVKVRRYDEEPFHPL